MERRRPAPRSIASASSTSGQQCEAVSRQGYRSSQFRRVERRLGAVNLTGVFLGTKLCLPALREAARQSAHGGVIVNLASTADGSTQDPLYSMAKSGATRSHQVCRSRIRSQRLPHPGQLDPSRHHRHRYGRPGARRPLSKFCTNDIETARSQVIDRLPIGRIATPKDIARGIVFLASEDPAFMTGAGLVIDGGVTAQ